MQKVKYYMMLASVYAGMGIMMTLCVLGLFGIDLF